MTESVMTLGTSTGLMTDMCNEARCKWSKKSADVATLSSSYKGVHRSVAAGSVDDLRASTRRQGLRVQVSSPSLCRTPSANGC